MNGHDRRKKGFTLLEVMVAMVVLMIAISGIYVSLISVYRLNRSNEETQLAILACQNEMENLLTEPFEDLPSKDGKEIFVQGLRYPDNRKNNGEVRVDTTYIAQGILSIKVTIQWKSANVNRTTFLQTFVEKK